MSETTILAAVITAALMAVFMGFIVAMLDKCWLTRLALGVAGIAIIGAILMIVYAVRCL